MNTPLFPDSSKSYRVAINHLNSSVSNGLVVFRVFEEIDLRSPVCAFIVSQIYIQYSFEFMTKHDNRTGAPPGLSAPYQPEH